MSGLKPFARLLLRNEGNRLRPNSKGQCQMSANLNKCKAWLIASNLIDQIIRYKENLKMKAIFNLPFSWTGHKPNRTSFICKEKKKKNVSHIISHSLQNNHFVSLKLKDSHLWIYSLRKKFTLSELMSILYKVNINTVFTINWLSPGIFNIKKADALEN